MYNPAIDPSTGLAVNAFSQVGGDILNQQVITTMNLYTPPELTNLFIRNGKRPTFQMFLDNMGYRLPSSNTTVAHYEKPWDKNLISFDSVTTPAGADGAAIVFQIAAADMYTPGVNIAGSAAKAAYVRKGDDVVLYSGKIANITVVNTATNPFTVTMVPKDPDVNMDDETTPGDQYFVAGNSWAEGSGLPKGRTPRLVKYSNTFQIIKHATAATGSELTNKTYIKYDGREGSYFEIVTKMDTNDHWMQYQSKALLFGEQNTNPILYDSGSSNQLGFDAPITGTEGFLPYVSANSVIATYTPGSYALTNFDASARQLEGQWIGQRYFAIWMGFDFQTEVENMLLNYFNSNTVPYVSTQMGQGSMPNDPYQLADANAYSVRVGFRMIEKTGFVYFLRTLHELNELLGAGASGYEYSQWGIITPFGTIQDPTSGETRPTIGYQFKELNGYPRLNIIETIDGVGTAAYVGRTQAANQYDIHTVGFLSEIAFHGACPNQIILQTPA